MSKLHFDFMGKRRIFFALSATLVVASVLALAFIGLKLGVEFQGGTIVAFPGGDGITVESVREALVTAEVADAQNATIQQTDDGGFLVRIAVPDLVRVLKPTLVDVAVPR